MQLSPTQSVEFVPKFSGHSTVPSPLAKQGAFSLVESVADVSVVVEEAAVEFRRVRASETSLPKTSSLKQAISESKLKEERVGNESLERQEKLIRCRASIVLSGRVQLTFITEPASPSWITDAFPRFDTAAVYAAGIRYALGTLRSRPSDATSALIGAIAETVLGMAVNGTGRYKIHQEPIVNSMA